MSYTVVGIFDSKAEARQAMDELVQNGFIEKDIDLSEGNYNDNLTADSTTASTTNTGVGDSVSSFFSNLFSDDETNARNYASVASHAEAILTVQADSKDRAEQVAAIFDRYGSVDVSDRATQYAGGYAQTSSDFQSRETVDRTATAGTAHTEGATIPVIEEELQVGKRAVEQGGVRVRSRVFEKPVEEHLRLRQERVIVNRHPVNRAVTDADLTNFKEGDFEITEHGEEAVVSKQARVVEEVEIGKQVSERDEVVRDTVRRTDVDVQEINTDVRAADVDTDIDSDINARRAGN